MKKSILLGALACSCLTMTGYGQSVEELLGVSVTSVQTPDAPTMTGHASAEESPWYVGIAVDAVFAATIDTNDTTSSGGTRLNDSQIQFDYGTGLNLNVGYRIPDSYVFIDISASFLWNGVKEFSGSYAPAGLALGSLRGEDGNFYQIPVMITPGLEFELPGQWPFLEGGAIRFGPRVGFTYQDLEVKNITTNITNDVFSFSSQEWVFAFGAMVSLDLFIDYRTSVNIGYQFIGNLSGSLGTFKEASGAPAGSLPDVETNFSYTNVLSVGLSFYF